MPDRGQLAAAVGRLDRLGRDVAHRLGPSGDGTRTLFIFGCQRSGTTMLMDAFGRDRHVKVFGEFSALNRRNPGLARLWPQNTRRYDIRMRPPREVARAIARVPQPMVVAKPLVESQRASRLLDAVPDSRAVWVFRHYRDVAASNVAMFGADTAVGNLAPVVAGEVANWRAEYVPDEVRALVARHYRPDMSPYDAGALFWYLRSRLYLDLSLDRDPRVLLLAYESLVREPDRWLARLYRHAGRDWPGHAIAERIHTGSVGRAAGVELAPPVAAVCEELWQRLRAVRTRS
jgi:hypothetical protein